MLNWHLNSLAHHLLGLAPSIYLSIVKAATHRLFSICKKTSIEKAVQADTRLQVYASITALSHELLCLQTRRFDGDRTLQ